MSKSAMKAELLKMLRDEMMEDEKEETMEEVMMPHKKMKATIMADSKEDLLKGAKELPKALSKAEEFMKMRMGESSKK